MRDEVKKEDIIVFRVLPLNRLGKEQVLLPKSTETKKTSSTKPAHRKALQENTFQTIARSLTTGKPPNCPSGATKKRR